ncbi:MAG: molybdenum cofactor biosynthesis protein MoaE [Planctomycetota bacterium]|jgi:molybdopterin synthase catalytic subunit
MISVNVVFFGPAKDFARAESASVELPDGASVADLRRVLSERYSGLRDALPTIRLAINEEFTTDDATLDAGYEVALIPPVSGGSDSEGILVDLVKEAIPVERVRRFVMGDPAMGGIVSFEGATREERDDSHGPLTQLDYEAYETMARRQMEELACKAKARWGLGRVAIVHRIGAVAIAEVSVMIVVAGEHRAQAFDACRWLIDKLKQDVPIWKKDVYQDGHVEWVEPGNNVAPPLVGGAGS